MTPEPDSGPVILQMVSPTKGVEELHDRLQKSKKEHPERFAPVEGHVTADDVNKSAASDGPSTWVAHVAEADD
jgi:hypothetical protein